jgi:large subunit ribosomal protein L29
MASATELRGMDDGTLQKQLDDLYHELFNLRFQRAAGQLPNFNRLREVRHDIGRVKTIRRQRETAAKSEEAKAQ